MERTITQRELRNESGEIMRGLDRGERFVVTRNGVPVGVLTPLERNRFVPVELIDVAFTDAPRVDADHLLRDLDAVADQRPDPRT